MYWALPTGFTDASLYTDDGPQNVQPEGCTVSGKRLRPTSPLCCAIRRW